MKFSLLYLPAFDAAVHHDSATLYQQIFEQVELAETLGFHGVWAAEHHFTPYGGDIPNPILFLAALAQRTKRMRLGTAGVALPLNRPINTAEQLAMVDAMSGGRLDIGVVRAFLHSEYESLNVDMNESRDRFNEGVDIIVGAFANRRFSYAGKYNQFQDIELRPQPVQKKPRIVVGTVATIESVRYAGLNDFDLMVVPYVAPLAKTRETIAIYHDALVEGGHDPAKHDVMAHFLSYLHPDEKIAKATAREPILRYVGYLRDCVADDRWSKDYQNYTGMVKMVEALMDFDLLYDKRTILGDAAHARECVEAYIDAGITEIGLAPVLPGITHPQIMDSLRLFGTEVLPHY